MTRAASAGRLYATALTQRAGLMARDEHGAAWPLALDRWLAPARGADLRVLDRAIAPVLDVGCGPGRHVRALVARGVSALGIDVSTVAVAHTRAAGAPAHHGDVFGPVPCAGSWATALLLDGNIGISGDPIMLLRRVASLLRNGGRILCELDPPGTGFSAAAVSLDDGRLVSSPFPWARVGVEALTPVAHHAGLRTVTTWDDDGRWFAHLVPSP
jgi:SAM-dependent methyltransferase